MGFGTNIMKTLMFIFNAIVWVLGLVLFVIGIVVLVEGKNWDDIIDGKTVPVSVMLIIVGLVIAVVGFLGCCGAMKQNGTMLLIYAIILGVIIIIQLIAGILAFIYSDEAEHYVNEGLKKSLPDYGKSESAVSGDKSIITKGLDWLQEKFSCCGINSSRDWARSMNIATYWISPSGGNHDYDTPDSCCKTMTTGCGSMGATGVATTINNEGCLDKGIDFFKEYALISGVCGFLFILFEAVAVAVACVLRRKD